MQEWGLLVCPFYPQLSVSVPCFWDSPETITGTGHHGVGEGREAAEKVKYFAFCFLSPKKEQVWTRRQDAWVSVVGVGGGQPGMWGLDVAVRRK